MTYVLLTTHYERATHESWDEAPLLYQGRYAAVSDMMRACDIDPSDADIRIGVCQNLEIHGQAKLNSGDGGGSWEITIYAVDTYVDVDRRSSDDYHQEWSKPSPPYGIGKTAYFNFIQDALPTVDLDATSDEDIYRDIEERR